MHPPPESSTLVLAWVEATILCACASSDESWENAQERTDNIIRCILCRYFSLKNKDFGFELFFFLVSNDQNWVYDLSFVCFCLTLKFRRFSQLSPSTYIYIYIWRYRSNLAGETLSNYPSIHLSMYYAWIILGFKYIQIRETGSTVPKFHILTFLI